MRSKLSLTVCCLLVILALSQRWASTAVSPQDSDQGTTSTPAEVATNVTSEGLIEPSDLIATGRCINLESSWINDGRNLVTLATIEVTDILKGNAVSTITVVLPGGVDANRRIPVAMSYPGAPTIADQEEVFLFLTNEDQVAAAYAIVGFAEGKFSIVTDDQGEKLVSRDLVKVRPQGGPGAVRGTRTMVSLSKFKEDVRSRLQ